MALELLADGKSPNETARLLAKKLGKSRRSTRKWMVRWINNDEAFQYGLAAYTRYELAGGLPSVGRAVRNRAGRGNPNMARLAMEASGFHNPKVDHKHSGEIKISITGIPRPSEGSDEVVDAEVVED